MRPRDTWLRAGGKGVGTHRRASSFIKAVFTVSRMDLWDRGDLLS